jgi:hypothetical protein
LAAHCRRNWRRLGEASRARVALLVLAAIPFALVQPATVSAAPLALPPPSTITTLDPHSITAQAGQKLLPSLATALLGFTANALVSANAASLSRAQVEPSAASNPSNRKVMVAGYADFVSDSVPGISRSTNGGVSWAAPTAGALLPNPPGLIWGDRSGVGRMAMGDAAVAWGMGETVYYSMVGIQNNANPPTAGVCNVGGLYVYRSSDGGNSWTLPAGRAAVSNTQTVFRDKPYIAVDSNAASSHAGAIYVTWDDDVYAGCPQNFADNFVTRRIMFSRSSDGGASWSTPSVLASGCLVSPIPAVGTDGSVYVGWYDCNSGERRELVRRSSDGGLTFSASVPAGSGLADCPNPLPGASFRVNGPFPTIATDPTDPMRVYVAWSSCTASAQADVFFSRSNDRGATWSATPLRLNDDGTSNPRDQFFPWMVVDDSGVVRVMWGDDRLDTTNPGGHNYDIFSAASIDHGASFGSNVRVTTQSSNPDNDGFGGSFIGDYFGMANCGTPVWDDTRSGNQDIFGAGLDADRNGSVDSCAPAPTISGFKPTSGAVGSTVTISGANFKGVTGVSLCFVSTSFNVLSATSLTAKVPAGACDGRWRVTTPAGTAASEGAFTVITGPPTISGFKPTSGAVGSTVTISGANFKGVTGVSLCFVSTSFNVLSATSLTAKVPAGACDGRWRVTTPAGTAASERTFKVT